MPMKAKYDRWRVVSALNTSLRKYVDHSTYSVVLCNNFTVNGVNYVFVHLKYERMIKEK